MYILTKPASVPKSRQDQSSSVPKSRLDVGGHAYYPDFTIRHPVTGEYFYWEHCGKMGDFKYIIKFLNKFRIYILNGYLPDHNLILTFESENHPFDITIAQDKLREFLICKDPFKCA